MDNNKTIQKIVDDSSGYTFLTNDKIPDSGSTEIKFKLNLSVYDHPKAIFGFVVGGTQRGEEEGLFYKQAHLDASCKSDTDEIISNDCWFIYLENGNFYNSGCEIDIEKGKSVFLFKYLENCSDDIISLCIDIENSYFYLKVNGVIFTTKQKMLNFDSTRKSNLYAFVSIFGFEDMITLID